VRRLRTLFGASLCLVLLVLGGLVVHGYRRGSGLPPEAPQATARSGPQASLTLNGVHVTETSGDATRWELRAVRGEYFESRQLTVLSDVEVTFFTRDGRTLTLRGDSGELFTDTKDISVEGNVVATSSDGYRVTTAALDYTNGDRTVRGAGPVALVGQAVEVLGKGVAIDVEDQRVSIPNGVASVLRPAESPARTGGGS
jgi:LPS export ABC transporter protein LptC